MPNQTLVRDLNSLVKRAKKSNQLPDRPVAGRILGGRGVGERKPVTAVEATPAVISNNPRIEVLSVWSELLVLEDIALEVPVNWPSDGSYVSGAVGPGTLPEDLYIDGGILKLDIKANTYRQKRMHQVYYEREELDETISLLRDDLFVPMEYPFRSDGYYQGIVQNTTLMTLQLYMTSIPAPSVDLQAQIDILLGLGVSFGG